MLDQDPVLEKSRAPSPDPIEAGDLRENFNRVFANISDRHSETSPSTVLRDEMTRIKKKNKFALFCVIAGVAVFLTLGAGFAYVKGAAASFDGKLPPPQDLFDPREAGSVSVLTADGTKIATRGSDYAGAARLNEISPNLIKAVIATEDKDFFDHSGVDFLGIIRAFKVNFSAGHIVQGGSGITQQLAKDLFLTADRSYQRKLKEVIWAFRLERNYNKDEILEIYLNRAYFGAGVYGVRGAAKRFFNKTPDKLSLAEAAVIAGALKAPSRYNPVSDFSAARKRSAIVLKRMFVTEFITRAEYEHALSFGFAVKSEGKKYGGGYIADEIRSLTPKILGEKAYNALTAHSDAVVVTTIDNLLQEAATLTIESYLKVNAERIGLSQAAFVAINDEGAVIAMSGGADYNHSQFNRATQALRQPGSAFKPFVYAAAIEKGDFDPDDMIEDSPIRIGNFTPQNYTGKYRGEMSLRSAFAYSANTPAVRLAQYAGLNEVAELAERAGIKTPQEKNMALALGASEVNLLELTAAYLPFFNGGTRVDPFFIRNIYEQDGRLIYENKVERGERVMSPLTAQRMRELLHATVDYGTGTKAKLKTGLPVFGKTGTASDYRDAWFVGRVGGRSGITAGVWLGNDNSAPGKEDATGGASAAKLWKGVFDVYLDAAPKNIALLQKNPVSYYQAPRQSPDPAVRTQSVQPATTQPKQSVRVQEAPAKKTEPDDYNPSRIEELLLKLGQ